MWRVHDLDADCPPTLSVWEDRDFVYLLCHYCGDKEVFAAPRAAREAILRAAIAHTRSCGRTRQYA